MADGVDRIGLDGFGLDWIGFMEAISDRFIALQIISILVGDQNAMTMNVCRVKIGNEYVSSS